MTETDLKKADEKLSKLEDLAGQLVQIVENLSGYSYRDYEIDQKRDQLEVIRGGKGA
jgi:hypothetical protein